DCPGMLGTPESRRVPYRSSFLLGGLQLPVSACRPSDSLLPFAKGWEERAGSPSSEIQPVSDQGPREPYGRGHRPEMASAETRHSGHARPDRRACRQRTRTCTALAAKVASPAAA